MHWTGEKSKLLVFELPLAKPDLSFNDKILNRRIQILGYCYRQGYHPIEKEQEAAEIIAS